MAEIFFSYSSKDRDRVRPLRDALVGYGFSVFWDQEVPAGTDWDTWIRRHLAESNCVIAIWSANSVGSDNVRHEATIAKQQNKLVPILIESLIPDQFPMGLYAMQAANLSSWNGELQHAGWLKLVSEIEFKLSPAWLKRRIDSLDAELVAERARRESAERRDRVLRDQIAKEAETQQEVRAERDRALDDIEALKTTLEAALREQTTRASRIAELTQQVVDAEERCQQQEMNAHAVMARLEESTSILTKARDDALEQAAKLQERCRDAEARTTELTSSLRDAHAKILALESCRTSGLTSVVTSLPLLMARNAINGTAAVLESKASEYVPSLSSLRADLPNDAGIAVPKDATTDTETPSTPSIRTPSTTDGTAPRSLAIRLRIGAVGIGAAVTLTLWAVEAQFRYPDDFLIKYNYLIAAIVLGVGLMLLRDVNLLAALPFVVTWSILGSAITLLASESMFMLYYPNGEVPLDRYFLSFGAIAIWLFLAYDWRTAFEPRRKR